MEIKANVSSVLVGRVLALLVILIGFIAAIWAGVEAQRDRFWIFLQMKKTLLLAILPMVLVLAVGYVGGPTAVSAQEVNPPTAEIEVGGPTGRSVDVGERFLLSFTLGELSGSGDHGGITISFPSLTDPDESSAQHVYSSSQAHVDVSLYSGDRSNVHFREVGDTIYSASGRTMPAEHLLVEFDEPSWTESSSITIVLRVTPKQNGRFDVRYRQWVCSDAYDNCSRADRSATVLDQQGWRAHAMTVDVTEPPADDSGGAQEDDHGDSRGGSTVIREGSTTAGDIERSGDWDYFRFRAEGGREYTIETRTESDTEIELYDGDGDSIDSDDDGGQGYGSRLVWRAPSSGDYYVAVRGYANEVTGSYTLSVTGEEPAEPSRQPDLAISDIRWSPSSPSAGAQLTFPYTVHNLGTGDSGEFGNELVIDNAAIDISARSSLAARSSRDRSFTFLWTCPAGTHSVRVRADEANEVAETNENNNDGLESLTCAAEAQDDHGDSRGGSTVIREGSTTAGDIERSGDWDYFRFRAEGGREYTIETRTDSDTEIELYDGDGDSIDSDDDGGEGHGSRLVWRAPSSGDYYVAVRGYANEVTGSYTLSVTGEEPTAPIVTGWEDDFWEVLIDAPASDFAHTGYMTTDTRVKVSMGPVLGDGGLRELAIDIVHEDGIDGHGHVNLLLPQGAWVSYDHIRKWIRVPTDRDSEDWQWVYYHPRQERAALGINEGLLTLVGMIPVIGPLMATAEYLEFAFPDEQRRPEAVEFYGNYRNCYRSVTVPWFVAGYPAGVKVVIPVIVATDEFVALASEFTARRLERGATARQREVTFELGSIEVTDLLGAGQPTSCGPR